MQWSDTVGNTGILQEILDSLEQPLTDTGKYTFVSLLRRANQVMRKICEQSECLKVVDTSNVSVAGQAVYPKPTGCSRIVRVAYGYTQIFGILNAQLDMANMGNQSPWQTLSASAATPVARYIEDPANLITLWPVPADSGTTISIEYIAQPTEMVNPNDIPFNAYPNLYSFHDLIVAGTLLRVLRSGTGADRFAVERKEWESEYKNGMKDLKEFVKNMPDTQMSIILMGHGNSRGRNIGPLPGFGGF